MLLHNLNLNIDDQSKIGIVGRTGAEKSSITADILRMPEAFIIMIDGMEEHKLNAHEYASLSLTKALLWSVGP